jgi:hypothetical protein
MPGYHRGDLDLLTAVFEMNSSSNKMTLDGFFDSRYLRYWPGSKPAVEEIWREVTGGAASAPSFLHAEQLPDLLARLDDVALRCELEMEQERVTWEIEELNYNFLENFFEKKARGRKLSFSDFLSFENIQAEMWYNEKGEC